jgi:hypothetical protein
MANIYRFAVDTGVTGFVVTPPLYCTWHDFEHESDRSKIQKNQRFSPIEARPLPGGASARKAQNRPAQGSKIPCA